VIVTIWEIVIYRDGWERIGMIALDSYPHSESHAREEVGKLANRFGIFPEIFEYPYTLTLVRSIINIEDEETEDDVDEF